MSKPLTIEQLKALKEDDWIYIKDLEFGNDFYAAVTDTYLGESAKYINIASAGWYQEFWFEAYGTEWIAYKNKEQAENKDECMIERIEKAYEHNVAECKRCMKKVDIKHQFAMESMKEHIRKETAKEILQDIFSDNDCGDLGEFCDIGWVIPMSKSKEYFKKYGVEVDE